MIALAGAEDPGNRWRASAPLDETGEVELKVPGIPGYYELRYIVSSDRQIAASQALTVTPVTATVEAPATVAAGSKVVVRWTGPANENDMIALAGAEDPGNRWRASAPLDETGEVELKVPGIPGDYELRYIVITDRQIAASQALAVQPVTATLDAPDAVAAGAKVAVRWTGPGNENDFVTLAETGTPGNQWFSFTTVSAAEGTTELKAPDEPGDYVLRYVLNSDRQIVAEIPLTVN
ncbi:MAG: hypothetical protein HKN81_06405 [Gammaproteobacteria bacterium]|nr:hypothetical protein [Gammaproteobacteria bacterium]